MKTGKRRKKRRFVKGFKSGPQLVEVMDRELVYMGTVEAYWYGMVFWV